MEGTLIKDAVKKLNKQLSDRKQSKNHSDSNNSTETENSPSKRKKITPECSASSNKKIYLNKNEYINMLSKVTKKRSGTTKVENSHQQKLRCLYKSPVFIRTVNGQYSGMTHNRLSQLSSDVITRTRDKDIIAGYQVFNQIRILDINSRTWQYTKFDKGILYSSLKKLNNLINNFDRSRMETGVIEDPEIVRKNALLFLQFGGVHILLRILILPSIAHFEPVDKKELCHYMRNKCLIFSMLSNLISLQTHYKLDDTRLGIKRDTGNNIAVFLANQNMDDDMTILDFAFYSMSDEQTALPACQFIEDILQAKQEVFNISKIKNLKKIIINFDSRQLANFCRICSITISDLDVYTDKSSLYAQNKQKRSKGFVNIRDINQEFLLSISNLLPRLVKIGTCNSYLPREGNSNGELSQWMDWINITMDNNVYTDNSTDDFQAFIGGISAQTSANGPMIQQLGLHISGTLILRVQVIYVLGLFLVGKHRKKVQKKLAELKIMPSLSTLFDQFIWKCVANQDDNQLRLRGHNDACECSPEVALKIQFLRLVHSFCDHSDYKHLLLCPFELAELISTNNASGILKVDTLKYVDPRLMCQGAKGLLTKIIEVMKLEPITSTFRFWLARAVESFLRGSPAYCDQLFLLRRGLLSHVVNNLIDHDITLKEIIQSSFDLISELVKFNVDAFEEFNKILNSKKKLEKFFDIVNKNLVDSNMFIRSLLLSAEHFKVYEKKPESVLLSHISKFSQQILYLQQLIRLINVENLTQENVSCLNTTLVFVMFANRRSVIASYLTGLNQMTRLKTSDNKQNLIINRLPANAEDSNLVSNFRDLLVFWQDHYLHKDKDCSALEKSSRIKFDYWKSTVEDLVNGDASLPSSTLYYVRPVDKPCPPGYSSVGTLGCDDQQQESDYMDYCIDDPTDIDSDDLDDSPHPSVDANTTVAAPSTLTATGIPFAVDAVSPATTTASATATSSTTSASYNQRYQTSASTSAPGEIVQVAPTSSLPLKRGSPADPSSATSAATSQQCTSNCNGLNSDLLTSTKTSSTTAPSTGECGDCDGLQSSTDFE